MPGTLFPHALIDTVMPTLSGTQWQLLCVIVRQTQGWLDRQTGGRKQSDWLSHSQLRRRTGRGSDALCRAVDALVQKKLIEVRDEKGQPLFTPSERRRSGSHLFYSLAPQLLARFQSATAAVESIAGHQSPAGKSSATVPVSRFGKAETTKETLTKERQKKPFAKTEWSSVFDRHLAPEQESHHSEGCGCFTALPSPARPASIPTATEAAASESTAEPDMAAKDPEIMAFIQAHAQKHLKYFGPGDQRTILPLDPKQRRLIQAALSRYGSERLLQLLEVFFESDTFYVRRHGHSLPVFLKMLPVLPFLRLAPTDR